MWSSPGPVASGSARGNSTNESIVQAQGQKRDPFESSTMPKPFSQPSKSTGFHIGPNRLDNGRGTYDGHAKRIKATLIHKATVKKSYYKTLEREGYGGTGSNGGELGVRRVKKVKPVLGEQRRGAVEENDDDEEQQDEQGEELPSEPDSDDEEPTRSKKSVKRPSGPTPRSQPPSRTAVVPSPTSSRRPKPYARPAEPVPVVKARLSPGEIEAINSRKSEERKEWGRKSIRGQPKLGGRVELLLGRIKRSMQ